jgi:prepilin-type N-terminal cleavage/methylation domain-containing protein
MSYELSAISRRKQSLPSPGRRVAGSPRRFSPRPAFSLVELLVVIGIITLLIGIALPAFSAAKNSARKATTTGAITSIGTGCDMFRADEKLGGQYPPSYCLADLPNPHLASAKEITVDGANLVAWALAGADLLGTPGFRDLNHSDPNAGKADLAGLAPWAEDVTCAAGGLYYVNNGQPAYARSALVDVTKMKFPTPVRNASGNFTGEFTLPIATKPQVSSVCFLDAWGQPILYYRANAGRTCMARGNAIGNNNLGVYNAFDNADIAGVLSDNGITTRGIDLGAGKDHFVNGLWGDTSLVDKLPDPSVNNKSTNTFAHTIWNPAVTTTPTSHNPETYILLSAGPDGLFGTEDDIGNFPANK